MGGWGETWLDRVRASGDWELAAIVDSGEAPLAAARARHGLPESVCFASVPEAAAVGAALWAVEP